MSVKPEIVMARVWRRKDEQQAFAMLLWPMEPANTTPGPCMSWEYFGQHGAADLGVIGLTRPATKAETDAAIRQWRSEGPGRGPGECPLVVRQRRPRWDDILKAHREQLGRG